MVVFVSHGLELQIGNFDLVDVVYKNFSVKTCIIPTASFRKNIVQPPDIRP